MFKDNCDKIIDQDNFVNLIKEHSIAIDCQVHLNCNKYLILKNYSGKYPKYGLIINIFPRKDSKK